MTKTVKYLYGGMPHKRDLTEEQIEELKSLANADNKEVVDEVKILSID